MANIDALVDLVSGYPDEVEMGIRTGISIQSRYKGSISLQRAFGEEIHSGG